MQSDKSVTGHERFLKYYVDISRFCRQKKKLPNHQAMLAIADLLHNH